MVGIISPVQRLLMPPARFHPQGRYRRHALVYSCLFKTTSRHEQEEVGDAIGQSLFNLLGTRLDWSLVGLKPLPQAERRRDGETALLLPVTTQRRWCGIRE